MGALAYLTKLGEQSVAQEEARAVGHPTKAEKFQILKRDFLGMELSRVEYYLRKYSAVSLQQEDFKEGYLKWALSFFTNPDVVIDPYLDMTLQLDITQARENYENHYKCNESTLTAFLTWKLLKTLKRHTHFLWRYIQGTWYELKNPPLFPIGRV